MPLQIVNNILYLCEIKFSREKISSRVIEEVRTKMDRIACPKRFSIIPLLVHVNGVTEELAEQRFFSRIIDFGDLLVRE